jgi:multimeric flavodoxin WrbA
MSKIIYAISGSPRKGYNTDILLQKYLEGASSVGDEIETRMIYLYDYDYKGCMECMACKRKGSKLYGQCSYPDGIKELLKEVSYADGIVFGTPVYFYEMTAHLRAFIERLIYPYTQFKKGAPRISTPKSIPIDYIYTMNVSEDEMKEMGYLQNFAVTEKWVSHIFGYEPNRLYSCYTYQYKNYDLYVADTWDIELKKKVREEQFPKDMERAYQMGKQIAEAVVARSDK